VARQVRGVVQIEHLAEERQTTIGGMRAEIVSVDALPESPGVDQVAVSIPRALAGRGDVEVALVVDGLEGNVLRLNIR
jgi:uncharacterized protein (TIGR03437 family)